jgi:hypothetical protein
MGEMGVISGNAAHSHLTTLGASPCVIYAVALDHPQAGRTSILAHVHRGNKLSDLQGRIERIMADTYNTPGTRVKAYVVTELYAADRLGEREPQRTLIRRLEQMTAAVFGTQPVVDTTHSAAALDHATGDVVACGDGYAPFRDLWLNHVFNPTNFDLLQKTDAELTRADDNTPMRMVDG